MNKNSFIDQKLVKACVDDFASEVFSKLDQHKAHGLFALAIFAAEVPLMEILAGGDAAKMLATLKMMAQTTLAHVEIDWREISARVAKKHDLSDFAETMSDFAKYGDPTGGSVQ